ncbi:hypothetical protein H7Y63_02780 [Polaromonas sp.]|nr:hypothetical protein [Candidatus Saccharibacteria bacterium]
MNTSGNLTRYIKTAGTLFRYTKSRNPADLGRELSTIFGVSELYAYHDLVSRFRVKIFQFNNMHELFVVYRLCQE